MTTAIKKTYKRCSDGDLAKLAHRITESLNGNLNFPDPTPAHAVLVTAVQEYQTAMNISGRNDRTLSSAKNDKKAALISLLEQLAEYVTAVSGGDRTKLLTSGFDIAGSRIEAVKLTPIVDLSIVAISPGEATVSVKRVAGARSYIFTCTPDPITPDSRWTSVVITDPIHTFSNLQSVVRYWFKVSAVGRDKQAEHSALVSRVIN